jgi:hypothetical protein
LESSTFDVLESTTAILLLKCTCRLLVDPPASPAAAAAAAAANAASKQPSAQQVMQALSHYSYSKSGGQVVLCDLQGGLTSQGAVLTGAMGRCDSGCLTVALC